MRIRENNIKMKKYIAGTLMSLIMTGAFMPALADTTGTSSVQALIQTLQQQILSLTAQLDALKKVQSQVVQTQQDIQGTLKLISKLREGMTGDDVKLLQTVLASDGEVYPEGKITGSFGRLTALAVKRFQKKHNLDQVGNVGPKTLKKLNEVLQQYPVAVEERDGKKEHCAIVPPGHLIAPGWLRKQNGEKPIVPSCQVLPYGIKKQIEVVATTTPDTTAPVISGVSATNITSSSGIVVWTTNESAKSKVYYGTNPVLNLLTASSLVDNTFVTSHSVGLSGLAASTTYYYVVESADASRNVATSTQASFNTLVAPDTTAPVISSISALNLASTSITVSWVTNENATSKVYYGATSPLNISNAISVSDSALLINHSLGLSGLSASTTYYYVVESKDAANNTMDSSEQSFITTQQ